ncbi:hypothetical protein GQ42DRAFT_165294, partial [Ramicandelaber brevisporus]
MIASSFAAATRARVSATAFRSANVAAVPVSTLSLLPRRIHTSVPAKIGAPTPNPEKVPVHAVDRMEGSYHWDFERFITVALIPIVGAQVAAGAHPTTDLLLGLVLPIHCHIGFGACITDYVPVRKYGKWNTAAVWALRAGTLATLVACYNFNTTDVGLTELVVRSWKA